MVRNRDIPFSQNKKNFGGGGGNFLLSRFPCLRPCFLIVPVQSAKSLREIMSNFSFLHQEEKQFVESAFSYFFGNIFVKFRNVELQNFANSRFKCENKRAIILILKSEYGKKHDFFNLTKGIF